MKTLILYATKHGGTHEVAKRIAKHIDGAVLHNLKQDGIPPIADFDCVILGSSLYVGSIRKEAKLFLKQNADTLKKKRLGLFLCGMQMEEQKQFFTSNFSPDILESAKATAFLGGIFDPKKSGFMERCIMKAVAKMPDYINNLDDEKIELFVKELSI